MRELLRLLLIIIIFIISGFNWNNKSNTYDIQRVINTIKELSSREYNGRMSGTLSGQRTENYIESNIKKLDLNPVEITIHIFKGSRG